MEVVKVGDRDLASLRHSFGLGRGLRLLGRQDHSLALATAAILAQLALALHDGVDGDAARLVARRAPEDDMFLGVDLFEPGALDDVSAASSDVVAGPVASGSIAVLHSL